MLALAGKGALACLAAAAVRLIGVSEHNTLAAAAGLVFGSLDWLPLTRRWSARGHLCRASSIFLFVFYLAYVLDWTFASHLGIAGTAGGLLLWLLELIAAVMACAYLWEICDARGQRTGAGACQLSVLRLRLELLDLVFEQRGRDGRLPWLAPQERFGELLSLLDSTLPVSGGSSGLTFTSTQGRTGLAERLGERGADLARAGDLDPEAAVGGGERRVVHRRLRVPDAVLGVAEHHLLPQDLAERVVVVDYDLDRQVVLDGGEELGHQHGEPAIARSPWPRPPAGLGCSTVASASGTKCRIFRSSRSSISAGSDVSIAYTRKTLRIRPMITAAGKPLPATSPTTAHTWPDGNTKASCQSPPIVPLPGA